MERRMFFANICDAGVNGDSNTRGNIRVYGYACASGNANDMFLCSCECS